MRGTVMKVVTLAATTPTLQVNTDLSWLNAARRKPESSRRPSWEARS
jgi:hypothetical protein